MKMRSVLVLAITPAIASAGCFGEPWPQGHAQVVAEIQSVPIGVGCLRVVYRLPAATADTTRNFPVTPGQFASLDFGYLPAGSYSFRASAFGVACGSVSNSTQATWVGDPASATLRAGFAARVELTLRPNVSTTSTVDFVQPVRAIYAGLGSDTTFAVMQDGTVRAWGRNEYGQMGDGTTATNDLPRTVVGLTNPTSIDGSDAYACAATPSGLACWGQYEGLLADDGPIRSLVPRFNADVEPAAVVGSANTLCGLFGTNLQCWHSVETLNGPAASATGLALSRHYALPTERALFFVGLDGTLMRAAPSDPSQRTYVRDRVRATTVQLNRLNALLVNGRVSSWNYLDAEEVGPEVAVDIDDAEAITSGIGHTCALTTGRAVRCWGSNVAGQLGANTDVATSQAPLTVPLNEVAQVAAGRQHTCALRADGTVWCWGDNRYGQLGDGTRVNRFGPVRVRF